MSFDVNTLNLLTSAHLNGHIFLTFILFLYWLGGKKRRHRNPSQFTNNKFFPASEHKQPLFNSAPHFPRYGLKLFAMKLLNAEKKIKC